MTSEPRANRAVLLTPRGAAAIAVVRVAGAGAPAFLRRHFSRPVAPDRCVYGRLVGEGGAILDDAVVVAGDGFADLNLHGGPWVVRSVLDLLGRCGFEVTECAVGDVGAAEGPTLVDREVSAHLGSARTELG